MEITHEISSRKNYHQVNIVPGALPYKKTGWGGGKACRKFWNERLRGTKILFCGRGLKCSSPLRGTSSSDLIWSEAFPSRNISHWQSPSSLQSAVSLDRRSSRFQEKTARLEGVTCVSPQAVTRSPSPSTSLWIPTKSLSGNAVIFLLLSVWPVRVHFLLTSVVS